MIIKYHLFSTFYLSQKIKGGAVFNNKNPWNKKEEDENFIFKGLTQKPKEEAKSPAEILYQNSNEEKNRQNKNNEYKNELLSMLGNNATAADVLYSDNTELENKVKNLNSKNNSNNSKPKESLRNKAVKTTAEAMLGKYYDIGYFFADKAFGPDTTGMVDLAHGDKMKNKDYIKDVIHIKNYNDPSVASDKKYLSDKISLIVNSYCIQNFGIEDYRSTIINTIFSLVLIFVIVKLKRVSYYGLTKVRNLKRYLYFIPLLLIISVNLWNGININNTPNEIIFYILTMINVGFLEEVIFRGFLFKMMEKDNINRAIIISAFTFGIGHIINLLNGANLIPTLMQVCYAISAGYLFVIIFYKSKSLIPCIITHCLVNSLSIFNVENTISLYVAPMFLTIVPLVYAIYINKSIKEQDI